MRNFKVFMLLRVLKQIGNLIILTKWIKKVLDKAYNYIDYRYKHLKLGDECDNLDSSEGQRIGLKDNDKRLLGPECTCNSPHFESCPVDGHYL